MSTFDGRHGSETPSESFCSPFLRSSLANSEGGNEAVACGEEHVGFLPFLQWQLLLSRGLLLKAVPVCFSARWLPRPFGDD